jgi:hypothetical protein
MPKDKIDAASRATDAIFDHVGTAMRSLNEQFEGRVINGYGICRDPSQARLAVGAAIDELRKAVALFDATQWPTREDYEAG